VRPGNRLRTMWDNDHMSWWTPIAAGIAVAQKTAEMLRVSTHAKYWEGSARDRGFNGEKRRHAKRGRLRSEERRVGNKTGTSKR
jgi:hypothetical protein